MRQVMTHSHFRVPRCGRDAFRVIVSKRLALLGLAAGVGQDRIRGETSVLAVINETIGGAPLRGSVALTGLDESTRRNTAFVNASFSLLVLRVVGEFGWAREGSARQTLNTFGSKKASDGYRSRLARANRAFLMCASDVRM